LHRLLPLWEQLTADVGYSRNTDIDGRDGYVRFVPIGDMVDGSLDTRPDCSERYSLKIDARCALFI
jgi:hypothetical protein